jgi:hypothetical protein
LIARADFKDQTLTKIKLLDGHWPSRKMVAVEKGADTYFNIHQGQQVTFRIDDHIYTVQVGGLVFNAFSDTPAQGAARVKVYESLAYQ